ncbi:extensin family protein [Qipengyuania sediminis]|uniref:extensin family protein n=1 Tax=Qipengyuania sediminis TaxID=1532023 RepID=UPI00105A377F|nr:extensin family protein [Qipengyuania sediminis]
MTRALAAAGLLLALAGCSLLPQRTPQRPPAQRPAPGADTARCLAALDSSGARFVALPDRIYAPGCQAMGAVRIDGLAGDRGTFQLSGLGPVACPLAQAFAGWARFGVDRAARQMLGSGLARIETMGSYACRPVAGRGRMSAHARAEAIDIGGFVLEDGRRISVKAGWNGASDQERAFLGTVHASACKRFGTVLGPAYNAAHADHFHVELGNGSFCR